MASPERELEIEQEQAGEAQEVSGGFGQWFSHGELQGSGQRPDRHEESGKGFGDWAEDRWGGV